MTLPGIALSGYGQEEDMQQSREAGFAVHLTKPVDFQRLKEVAARLTASGSRPHDVASSVMAAFSSCGFTGLIR